MTNENEKREFQISRKVWLRGEGAAHSFLLRSDDNKMCCLGIFLEHCGVPRKDMLDVPSPGALFWNVVRHKTLLARLKLVDPERRGKETDATTYLMRTNDWRGLSDAERESTIAEGFAKLGWTVTFVD